MMLQILKSWWEGRSPQWPKVRADFLVAHPFCAACGGRKNLEVHHVTPFHVDPSRELDVANLIALCENPERLCHFRDGHCFSWQASNPTVRQDAAAMMSRVFRRVNPKPKECER